MACGVYDPLVGLALKEIQVTDFKPEHCDILCAKMYEYLKDEGHTLVTDAFSSCECNTVRPKVPLPEAGSIPQRDDLRSVSAEDYSAKDSDSHCTERRYHSESLITSSPSVRRS